MNINNEYTMPLGSSFEYFLRTEVKIKPMNDLAKIPTRGSDEAAGWDLYAAIDKDIEIQPHTTKKIDTGIAIALPRNTFGALFPRSGIATKRGLRLANSCGIIDSDYRGSVIAAIHNDTNEIQKIEKGERIAQLIVLPFVPIKFNQVDKLDGTVRGSGGFGSTGVK